MVNPQLLDYVKQQVAQGVSKETIEHNLISQGGWSSSDINEVFSALGINTSSNMPIAPVASVAAMTSVSSPVQSTVPSLPGIFALFGQAWSIYTKKFWTLISIFFIPTVLSFLLKTFSTPITKTPHVSIASTILVVFLNLILILISVWSSLALLYAVRDNQEPLGFIGAYKKASAKIVSYVWLVILEVLTIFGGSVLNIIPFVIVLVLLSIIFKNFITFTFVIPILPILPLIFMLIFFVAVIPLVVFFVCSNFILVNEDLKGFNALLKSREYARGHFGSILWRFIFMILFWMLAFVIINIVVNLIIGAKVLSFTALATSSLNLIFNSLIALFFTPLFISYTFSLYSHLKSLKGEFTFVPKKRGFYIFLAILGFILMILAPLSAVTLASLNAARNIGAEAAIKTSLNIIPIEAELYYDGNNNSYLGLCNDPQVLNVIANISKNGSMVSCFATQTTWAASAPLKSSNYCVDSTNDLNHQGVSGTAMESGLCSTSDISASTTTSSQNQNKDYSVFSVFNNASYNYSLPSGWKSITNTDKMSLASNKDTHYGLLIFNVALPAGTTTLDQVVNTSNIGLIIEKEFPSAVVDTATYGFIGGEKAIIVRVHADVVSSTTKVSRKLSMLQYEVVHKGFLYSIIFTSAYEDKDTAMPDFQFMINSFKFN